MTNAAAKVKEARKFYGQVFKSLRVSHDRSQSKAAELAGVTQDVISRLETGSLNIGLDTLIKILQTYDLKLSAEAIVPRASVPEFRLHAKRNILRDFVTDDWYFCCNADETKATYSRIDLAAVAKDPSRYMRIENRVGDTTVLTLRQTDLLPTDLVFQSARELINWANRTDPEAPGNKRGAK